MLNAMKPKGRDTRQRIIEAADALFYGEGVRAAGVDKIAEKAGLTKRTLYYHFSSKDELIAAYLEGRHGPTMCRYRSWFDQSSGTLDQRIVGIFAEVAKLASDPKWKGCGFARAAAELAGLPGHPAIAIASRHKHEFERWFTQLLVEDSVADSQSLAKQLMVLLDGAVTQIMIHRDPEYALVAGRAAATLIGVAARVPSVSGLSKARTRMPTTDGRFSGEASRQVS